MILDYIHINYNKKSSNLTRLMIYYKTIFISKKYKTFLHLRWILIKKTKNSFK